jgi:hypothetical protein
MMMEDQPMETINRNETPEDEQEELRRLFVRQMIDGLKASSPKASFLAVVQRYLSEIKGNAPAVNPHDALQQLVKPSAVATSDHQLRSLPFPMTDNATSTSSNPKPWDRIEAQPFTGPAFNAPKLT